MVEPVDLLLNNWIEASPLLMIFFGWELPEHLLQLFVQNRVSELKDVIGHQKDVKKVKYERINLL
jgi:hypothetical protein